MGNKIGGNPQSKQVLMAEIAKYKALVASEAPKKGGDQPNSIHAPRHGELSSIDSSSPIFQNVGNYEVDKEHLQELEKELESTKSNVFGNTEAQPQKAKGSAFNVEG